jgi:hypothetical protein
MTAELESVFTRLRDVLAAHAAQFSAADESPQRYGLQAPIGPATREAWSGKIRAPEIPVGWVEVRKAYVS